MADLYSLIQPLLEHARVRAAVAALDEMGGHPLAVSGLTPAAKAVVVAAVAHQLKRPMVVLTQDNEAAQSYRQTTATFLEWLKPGAGNSVQVLPALDCSPYEGRSPHAEIQEQRAAALWNLARGGVRVVFTPVAAALGRLREGAFYSSLALDLKVGDELNLDDLVEHLRSVGYEQGEPVAAVGQYSVRGGIVDVFPPEADWPFRLEFFGDQLESVREFDPSSQRSRKPTPRALLLPLSEAQRSPKFFERLLRVLILRAREQAQARGTPLPEREPDWAAEHANTFPGWEFFTPLVEPHTHTLFSLLDRPAVIWDEVIDRRAQISTTLESFEASFEEVRDALPPRPQPREVYLSEAELLQALKGLPQISLKELGMDDLGPAAGTSAQAVVIGGDLYFPPEGANSSDEWRVTSDEQALHSPDHPISPIPSSDSLAPAHDYDDLENRKSQIANRKWPDDPMARWPDEPIQTQPPPKFQGGVKALVEDLRVRVKRGESVIFVVPTSGKVDRLREILKDYEIPFDLASGGIGSSDHRVNKHQPASQTAFDRPILSAPAPSSRSPAPALHSPDGPMARWAGGPITRSPDFPGVFIARGEIREGVAFPGLKQLWLADADLFGGFDWAARGRRERSGISSFISDLSDLKVGDYVVHIDHGIGIYQGLRQLRCGRRGARLHAADFPGRRPALRAPGTAGPGGKVSLPRRRQTAARPSGRRHLGTHQNARQTRLARHGAGTFATLRRPQDARRGCRLSRHALAARVRGRVCL